MNKEEIIKEILKIFEQGSKTELILNILIYTEFHHWEQKHLKVFVKNIKSILISSHENNRILLCYNPILSIALSCEFLSKVGDACNIFEEECKVLIKEMLRLGRKIIYNMDEDRVPKIF